MEEEKKEFGKQRTEEEKGLEKQPGNSVEAKNTVETPTETPISEDKKSRDKKGVEKELVSEDEGKKQAEEELVSEDEDEEISIDFSKIKNWFKKKKPKPRPEQNSKLEVHEPEAGEKEFQQPGGEKDVDEEISIDWKKAANFMKGKKGKVLLTVILILIPIIFSVWFRALPYSLPATDDWAMSTISRNIKNNLAQQILQESPNLPKESLNREVNRRWQSFLSQKQNKRAMEQQAKQLGAEWRKWLQDDTGQTYLLAIDPYLWYGETRNYLRNGHFGTAIVNREPRNMLRNGRIGKGIPSIQFHPMFGVFLYKIFGGNPDSMSLFFIIPLLIISLAVIPAFFIARRFGGNIAGVFAGMIVAVNAALMGRTPAGFSDTDAYNIFFPLMIIWMFLESFEAEGFKKKAVYASLAGLFTGLYSFSWGGWWYVFDFVLAMIVIYLIYLIIVKFVKSKKDITDSLEHLGVTAGVFFFSSLLFVSLIKGFHAFMGAFRGPMSIVTMKEVGISNIWPNVLTTVAEFNEVPLKTIISQMGGKLLFLIAIIGIILTLVMKNKKGKIDVKYAILLIVWFIGTAYGFTRGLRFGILMVPAFAVAFGLGIGLIYKGLRELIKERKTKLMISIVLIIIFCLLMISPIKSGYRTAKSEVPSMNDAWYNALTFIKQDSEDAIITSWWDFGHWFVTISERRVTFDGADQGRRIHWVGKTLLTDDEEEAVDILKMLNCGQEKPSHLLDDYVESPLKAIKTLKEIIPVKRDEAKNILLQKGLTEMQTEEILKYSHCKDLIPNYFIASEDMVGKSGVWGHFGSWDFERAAMYQKVKKKDRFEGVEILKSEFGLSEQEASKIYFEIQSNKADRWVSPWPGYMSGWQACSDQVNNTIQCKLRMNAGNNIVIDSALIDLINLKNSKLQVIALNPRTGERQVQQPQIPAAISLADINGYHYEEIENATVGFGLVVKQKQDMSGYQMMVADKLLIGSTFTKMFFLNGHGLKSFDKVHQEKSPFGNDIKVYKVDWDGDGETNIYKQNKVHVAHILVCGQNNTRCTSNRTKREAQSLIEELSDKANRGNFAELASNYSDDPSGKFSNGDLGWFGKGQMVPEFENAAFNLSVGQISKPVESPFGWHLIYRIE